MRIRESFPKGVRHIENCWIPLPDGTRLAARVWLPEDARQHPAPAVVEAIPYRKRDFMRSRDEPVHHYFAGHGYAALRLDLRGSGDSEGVLEDEYSRQEHEDVMAAFEWIASQPWCNGSIGMMGISWGGFNALQVAARRPPQLKAVIALCASDDRYADDAHYMGGCLLNENLTWGSVLMLFNACPPDPEVVGGRWRDLWRERLSEAVLFPARWMRHQRRDDYWEHGSVCQDYSRIQCPVYAIGGWADGYSNAVPRLLQGLQAPCKGLVGPWAHLFPHEGVPGPAIGFLQEATAWWDRWLQGEDNGIMDEPAYRVWMQESVPPRPFYQERPGRWAAEEQWPSQRIRPRRFRLARGQLSLQPGPAEEFLFSSPQTVGLLAGEWCAFGTDGEMPQDQRAEDGKSLVFDSPALQENLEILGAPLAELELACDQPQALLAVRLNEIFPDGASTRVSYGILNLTHRRGHQDPRPLRPGKRYRVTVRLNDIAHVFAAGNRIRLSLSTSYWPLAWPSPATSVLTLFSEGSALELPERPPREADRDLRRFERPEHGPPAERVKLRPSRFERKIERDLTSNETVYTLYNDGAELEDASLVHIPDIGLDLSYKLVRRYRIADHDPLSAQAEVEQSTSFRRGDWSVRLRLQTRLCCTKTHFRIEARLEALEGEETVFQRQWDEQIPRDGI
ncbi:MAG TPA: CocE/NonD family hydrolase [Acidobacteriota bacterium]|nr:CocE/NonD family hydrolase [Acidobacteriota bacterium]